MGKKKDADAGSDIEAEEVSAMWNKLKKEAHFDDADQSAKQSVKLPKKPKKTPDGNQSKPARRQAFPESRQKIPTFKTEVKQEPQNESKPQNTRIVFDEKSNDTEIDMDIKPKANEVVDRLLTQLEKDVLNASKPHSQCLLGQSKVDSKHWFEQLPSSLTDSNHKAMLSRPQFDRLTAVCNRLYDVEVSNFTKTRRRTADGSWSRTVIKKGTAADRMAALAINVQESPFHSLQSLIDLIEFCSKKSRREVIQVLGSVEELFIDFFLPERKLRTLFECPLEKVMLYCGADRMARDRYLIIFAFEAKLKKTYADFVFILRQNLLVDEVLAVKRRAMKTTLNLLISKQELESELLSLLVNKFGDPDKATGASVGHHLDLLLRDHPMMKQVVVRQVEEFIFRPNLSEKAQYYAVCFLAHMNLHNSDAKLASHMLSIYFKLFSGSKSKEDAESKPKPTPVLKKKGKKIKRKLAATQIDEHNPQNSKLIAAILAGVNRAVQFADLADPKLLKNVDLLYTIVHTGSMAISVQALHLLYQLLMNPKLSTSSGELSERFYATLYAKLFDPDILKTSSRLHLLFNILFRSLKIDENLARTRAFLKRLLQIGAAHTPCVAAATLYLVSEVKKLKPNVMSNAPTLIRDEELDDEKIHDAEYLEEMRKKGARYDPLYRNPLHANSMVDSIWELTLYSDHCHPSVKVFAQRIIEGKHIDYDGDPLSDFILARFLDRFIHRKPKNEQKVEQVSKKIQADDAETELFAAYDQATETTEAQKTSDKAKKKREKAKKKKEADISDSEFDAFLEDHEDELLEELPELDEDDDDAESGDDDDFDEEIRESPAKRRRRSGDDDEEEDSDYEEDEDYDAGDDLNDDIDDDESSVGDEDDLDFLEGYDSNEDVDAGDLSTIVGSKPKTASRRKVHRKRK